MTFLMRRSVFTLLLLLTALNVAAQTAYISRIEPLRNEKWWGIFVGGGPVQPFTDAFDSDVKADESNSFTTPFMISNLGRCVWSTEPMSVEFDGNIFTVTTTTERADAVKGGKNLREAYLYCVHKNIWKNSGVPEMHLFPLPIYDTGLATTTAGCDIELLKLAGEITAASGSSGTFLIPDGWQCAYGAGYFDRNLYASFSDTARQLEQAGLSLMLTVTPYIPAFGRRYTEAKRAGTLITSESGAPVVFEMAGGYYACLDMTSPVVIESFEKMLNTLRSEYGITSFYFDCHRAIELLSADARLGEYTKNWTALGEKHGAGIYPLSAGVPSQWHPYSVSPGPELSWTTLQRTLKEIINSGLTGHIYPYISLTSAIGCCDNEELLLRAAQLALFMPLPMIPPTTDIFTTERYKQAMERSIRQRKAMNRYMEELLHEARTTGEPMLRHMEYQFPGQGFANCEDQYMLGAKYLIAPALDAADKRTVRLPKGVWIDAARAKHRGPRVINADVNNGEIAIFTLQ